MSFDGSAKNNGRELPNQNLYMSNKEVRLRLAINFGRVGSLEEKSESLSQIGARLLDCASLTCDVEFGTKGEVHIPLPLNQRGKTA